MRQSLSVISVLLGAAALAAALVVFRNNYSMRSDFSSLPAAVSDIERETASLREDLDKLARSNAELSERLVSVERRLDADPAALAKTAMNEEIDRRIAEALKREFDERLRSLSARSSSALQVRDADFDIMVGGLAAVLGADSETASRIRAACSRARADLNRAYLDKKIQPAERKKRLAAVRKRLVDEIVSLAGKDGRERFEVWKKTVRHRYSRRFFGLDDTDQADEAGRRAAAGPGKESSHDKR